MTRMTILVKLSMMSELCTPFITICSITDVLYYMNNQHTHKHLVCNTLVRLCFRHVGTCTRHAIVHQVLCKTCQVWIILCGKVHEV